MLSSQDRLLSLHLTVSNFWPCEMISMEGLDFFDTLSRELPLNQVLDRKVRRAAGDWPTLREGSRSLPNLKTEYCVNDRSWPF